VVNKNCKALRKVGASLLKYMRKLLRYKLAIRDLIQSRFLSINCTILRFKLL
jgi:hypothetical protein